MEFPFLSWLEWVLANNVAFSDEDQLFFTEQKAISSQHSYCLNFFYCFDGVVGCT